MLGSGTRRSFLLCLVVSRWYSSAACLCQYSSCDDGRIDIILDFGKVCVKARTCIDRIETVSRTKIRKVVMIDIICFRG